MKKKSTFDKLNKKIQKAFEYKKNGQKIKGPSLKKIIRKII